MNFDRSALASYFDDWYADMASTPVKDEVMQRHLGLPQHLVTTSTIPWLGIAELETALHLACGDTLLDLACGRGGIGLEIAARRGLAEAGFVNVQVKEHPTWRNAERAMWQEAAALDPAGNAALRSFRDEGVRSLETFDLLRRVSASATAPSGASCRLG